MADTAIANFTDGVTANATDRIAAVRSPFAAGDDRYLTPTYIGNYLATGTLAAGTLTTSQPLTLTQTWNDGAVTFTGLRVAITNTASAAASLLANFEVGSANVFRIRASSGSLLITDPTDTTRGLISAGGSGAGAYNGYGALHFGGLDFGAANVVIPITGGIKTRATFSYAWVSGTDPNATADLFLGRAAAAKLRMGDADAAAPVAQTLSVQNVVAGTTDTAGAAFTIAGSQGTGTGAGGAVNFQIAPLGGSGSAQNALATAWQISGAGHFLAGTDNTYDIGAAAATRPRNLHLGGYLAGAVQSLSGAGAVNLTTWTTAFTSTGAGNALTLADGVVGQMKYIVHVVDGGSGVLTPTNLFNGTTITFTNLGDSVILQFIGTEWHVIAINGAALA